MKKITQNSTFPSFDEAVAFHGHACPGLAMGYRVAIAAMNRLCSGRSEDEDLVAVVENNACGVDAVQLVCGCTFGKGNLIFHDYGKHVYTFFNRGTDKGIRIYIEVPEEPEEERTATPADAANPNEERQRRMQQLLTLPDSELLHIVAAQEPPPSKARIHASRRCARCGERMMETRVRAPLKGPLCIPCAERQPPS